MDADIIASRGWQKISEPQTFYLALYSGGGISYFGPYRDNIQRIIQEAKQEEARLK